MTIGNSNATLSSTALPHTQLTHIFNRYAGSACLNVADIPATAFDGGGRHA